MSQVRSTSPIFVKTRKAGVVHLNTPILVLSLTRTIYGAAVKPPQKTQAFTNATLIYFLACFSTPLELSQSESCRSEGD